MQQFVGPENIGKHSGRRWGDGGVRRVTGLESRDLRMMPGLAGGGKGLPFLLLILRGKKMS